MSEHNKKSSKKPTVWLTVQEVLDKLKISRSTLHDFSKDGKIQKYKLGDSVRYKSEDVDALMQPVSNAS